MYRVFFKHNQKKFKMFLKRCIIDWFEEKNLGPVIKSFDSKTYKEYCYSQSVDRFMGLLNNDGFLSHIPWNSIVTCLTVPAHHKFNVNNIHIDEDAQ